MTVKSKKESCCKLEHGPKKHHDTQSVEFVSKASQVVALDVSSFPS